jgi:hypothetical protein
MMSQPLPTVQLDRVQQWMLQKLPHQPRLLMALVPLLCLLHSSRNRRRTQNHPLPQQRQKAQPLQHPLLPSTETC